jgi:hypothetical protein
MHSPYQATNQSQDDSAAALRLLVQATNAIHEFNRIRGSRYWRNPIPSLILSEIEHLVRDLENEAIRRCVR